MSTLIASLIAVAAPVEVETGDLVWRIRRIGLSDLQGHPLSALALGARIRGGMQIAQGENPVPGKIPTLSELGPILGKSEAAQAGFLCIGIDAVRLKTEAAWTLCTIVAKREQEDASANRLHFLSIQPEWRLTLASAIEAHAAGEGAAAERLASFLGGSSASA